jgi:hypothetical protein
MTIVYFVQTLALKYKGFYLVGRFLVIKLNSYPLLIFVTRKLLIPNALLHAIETEDIKPMKPRYGWWTDTCFRMQVTHHRNPSTRHRVSLLDPSWLRLFESKIALNPQSF